MDTAREDLSPLYEGYADAREGLENGLGPTRI